MPVRRNSRQDQQLHKLRGAPPPPSDNVSPRLHNNDKDVVFLHNDDDDLSTIHSNNAAVHFAEEIVYHPASYAIDVEDRRTLWYSRFEFMRMKHYTMTTTTNEDDDDENDEAIVDAIVAVLTEQERQRYFGLDHDPIAIAAEYIACTTPCQKRALQKAKEQREAALQPDDDPNDHHDEYNHHDENNYHHQLDSYYHNNNNNNNDCLEAPNTKRGFKKALGRRIKSLLRR